MTVFQQIIIKPLAPVIFMLLDLQPDFWFMIKYERN